MLIIMIRMIGDDVDDNNNGDDSVDDDDAVCVQQGILKS